MADVEDVVPEFVSWDVLGDDPLSAPPWSCCCHFGCFGGAQNQLCVLVKHAVVDSHWRGPLLNEGLVECSSRRALGKAIWKVWSVSAWPC